MPIVDVKIPELSESVAEATMLRWKKSPSESVTQDEILTEIETDKVILEVLAPSSGILTELLKQEGETVVSNEVVAKIDTEKTVDLLAQPSLVKSTLNLEEDLVVVKNNIQSGGVCTASPAASKIIAEKGLSIDKLQGSGRDGRITKSDVKNARMQNEIEYFRNSFDELKSDIGTELSKEKNRLERRVPMSRLRARVAERLLHSQHTNAILTTFNEVNMKAVIDLRKKYKDKFEKEHGIKLGFMSFFVKSVVYSLKKYPIINASLDGNEIVYHDYFDIGIAVGSERGLVVPILRNADQLSLATIEKKIFEFAQKAKSGQLSLSELTGGTFSISNGGVFGSMLSTPIINPPQSAILGIHATKDRAVVENDQIVIRPMNYLAMSYDHRLIDGREAVLALGAIKEILEDPTKMLLEL